MTDENYQDEVERGRSFFLTMRLASCDTAAQTLSEFFEGGWSRLKHGEERLSTGERINLLRQMGFALRFSGRHEEALEPTKQSLSLAEDEQDWFQAAKACRNLAEMHFERGVLRVACEYAKRGVSLARKNLSVNGTESRPLLAELLYTFGDQLHSLGKTEEAGRVFEEVREVSPDPRGQFEFGYGLYLIDTGRWQEVLALVKRGLDVAPQEPREPAYEGCYRYLRAQARMTYRDDDSVDADLQRLDSEVREASELLQMTGAEQFHGLALLLEAGYCRRRGKFSDAHGFLDEAAKRARRGKLPLLGAEVHAERAWTFCMEADKDDDRDSRNAKLRRAEEEQREARKEISRTGYRRLERLLPLPEG